MTDQVEFRARPAAWLARVAVALVFAGALAACDTADYTVDWFDDDDEEETAAAEDGSQQPTDRPFPNLSSVPERPGPPEIELEAVSVKEGLTADKNNARYTDQALRSQTANVRPRPRVEKPADKPPAGAPTPADRAARPSAPPPPPPGSPAARRPPPPPPGSPAAERPAPEPAKPAQPVQPAQPAQAQVAAKPPAAQPAVSPSAPPRPAATETPAAEPKTVARPAPPPEPVTQDTAPTRARPAPPSVAAATAPKTPEPQAAPAAPAPAPQVPARAGTTTLVATIYFADGQTSLTQDDLTVLQQVMDIQRQGGGMVRVVGHSSMSSGIADPMRRRMVNCKVSLDRATIVAQSFRDMGLPGDRVAVEALGDAQPIYSEETAAGAAGNRRAEIFLDF